MVSLGHLGVEERVEEGGEEEAELQRAKLQSATLAV